MTHFDSQFLAHAVLVTQDAMRKEAGQWDHPLLGAGIGAATGGLGMYMYRQALRRRLGLKPTKGWTDMEVGAMLGAGVGLGAGRLYDRSQKLQMEPSDVQVLGDGTTLAQTQALEEARVGPAPKLDTITDVVVQGGLKPGWGRLLDMWSYANGDTVDNALLTGAKGVGTGIVANSVARRMGIPEAITWTSKVLDAAGKPKVRRLPIAPLIFAIDQGAQAGYRYLSRAGERAAQARIDNLIPAK